MATKKQLLIDTLEQPFEVGQYIKFVTEFFNTIKVNTRIQTNEKVWGEYSEHIKSYTKIGRYIDDNTKRIDVWAIELCSEGSVERARSLQRNFVSKLLTADKSHAGIIAFYVKDASTWRLSFVKLELELTPKGIQIETTPAKRYSYLVGEGEKSHTAQEQLLPIFQNEKENPTIEAIEEAFSIETVTKEFFAKYKEKYLQLKEYLEKNDAFVQTAEQHHFTTEQFAKKLMGQLAFLYFLQKKGWLGVKVSAKILTEKQYKHIYYKQKGDARKVLEEHYKQADDGRYIRTSLEDLESDKYRAELFAGCFAGVKDISKEWGEGEKNFIRHIYKHCIQKGLNFFDDYLEPLFYNALNNPRGKNCYFPKFNAKIPFLNGGLFEPLFDNWEERHFDIPNEIFSNTHIKKKTEADGILDIFERFNFTINEDEPLEREVAVDPEMLGKIFENLLDVKDRKSKGAFYTPREIVHYMCQESIINHLINETGVSYGAMKQFVLYGELITNQDNSRRTKEGEQKRAIPQEVFERIESIDKALADVRVADPAVGSGAFPLGMLNEIVKLRNNITQYMINAVPDQYPGQKDLLRINRHPYKLKWETIQNCIFAVDIEASAVDITKLRLWLSLIVDQEIDAVNQFPHALPNLDCNIMCGNSLIEEFEGMKLFDEQLLKEIKNTLNTPNKDEPGSQLTLHTQEQERELAKMFRELFMLQAELFGEDDPERKKDIKSKIDENIEEVIQYQLRYIDGNEKLLVKYKNELKNKQKPFFIWKLEFARVFQEKEGFDIVIGNPPYLRIQGIRRMLPELADQYSRNFKSATGAFDLYVLFVEMGLGLLNGQGIINYIMPHKWINSSFGKGLRSIISEGKNLKKFISFGAYQIFNATTYTSLVWFSKNKQHTFQYYEFEKDMSNNHELQIGLNMLDNDDFSKQNNDLGSDNWVFTNKKIGALIQKIAKGKITLKDVFKKVFQGIATSKDSVYFLKECIETHQYIEGFSEELQERVIVEKGLAKPLLKGYQIHRYETIETANFVIFPYKVNTDNKNKAELYTIEELENLYPKGCEYLKRCKTILENRESGKLVGDEYWYRYIYPKNVNLFNNEKIITPEISLGCNMIYDDGKYYHNTKAYSLIKKDSYKNSYKYYLAILNSNVLWFYLKNTGYVLRGGYYTFKTNYLEPFPLPDSCTEHQAEKIESLVSLIIQRKLEKGDTEVLEKQLNKEVYQLYELTDDEIRLLEDEIATTDAGED